MAFEKIVVETQSDVFVQLLIDGDPKLETAMKDFDYEFRYVEESFRVARTKAALKRLNLFKQQLKEYTQAGNFEKAIVCKAAIQQFETLGVASALPRPAKTVKHGVKNYALITEPATWHVAKHRCELMGGHLAFA